LVPSLVPFLSLALLEVLMREFFQALFVVAVVLPTVALLSFALVNGGFHV